MKNIRCAVWLKNSKEIQDVVAMQWNKNGELIHVTTEKTICNANQVERLLYTEIEDKNGKEIKEGDIVRLCLSHFSHMYWERGEKPPLSDERICTVEVENQTAYLVENEDSVWVLDLIFTGLVLREEASLEIIGNIYENPELLEGEDGN